MNDTIRTQLAHSSVRAFTNEPVTAELRTQILDAARAASTSCALQVTSIIRVTDPALRARIAELSGGQAHVAAAPEFWVFCADYHRLQLLCPEADLGWIEQFLVGCLDTGIMAQNAFTALEEALQKPSLILRPESFYLLHRPNFCANDCSGYF